jgi:ribosomal protein S18 acetylase RimI-like enzyme
LLCGHDGRRGFLYHLAVAPTYRGRGYGRQLTEICLAHLQRVGIPRATIHLYANNDEGKAFWNSTQWVERNDLVVMQFETTTDEPVSTAVT